MTFKELNLGETPVYFNIINGDEVITFDKNANEAEDEYGDYEVFNYAKPLDDESHASTDNQVYVTLKKN
jgi:hypothetical protein